MMGFLTKEVGIDGMLVAPGYQYSQIDPNLTMTRAEHEEKFRAIRAAVRKNGYRWLASPIYQDFLTGERELPCTPWGSITRNPYGWKGPCYLLTDAIFPSYEALIDGMEWERYGPGNDPRCEHCANPLRLRALGHTRHDCERQGDGAEPRVDAAVADEPLTLACALEVEERAARKGGARAARVGLGASRPAAGGRLVELRACRRARPRLPARHGAHGYPDRRRGGRDALGGLTACGARRPSGCPLRAPRASSTSPASARALARAHRRGRRGHGERRARARPAGSPERSGRSRIPRTSPSGSLAHALDARRQRSPGVSSKARP